MSIRSCLAALALAHVCVASAQPLDESELADLAARPSIGLYKAYAEFKMARYDSARSIWEALAEKGVAEAWFHLGILAEDGLGEARDPGAALARYRRAAEAGSAKAQYRLGLLYLKAGRSSQTANERATGWPWRRPTATTRRRGGSMRCAARRRPRGASPRSDEARSGRRNARMLVSPPR